MISRIEGIAIMYIYIPGLHFLAFSQRLGLGVDV